MFDVVRLLLIDGVLRLFFFEKHSIYNARKQDNGEAEAKYVE